VAFTVTRRSGLPSILTVAHKLCRLIVTFTPYIQRLYPDSPALLAALAAANAACMALGEEITATIEPGV